MGNVVVTVRTRWSAMGTGGRMWWGAASSLGVAALLVLGATSLTDAAGFGVAAASSHGASTPSTGSSSGMSGMAGMSGRSSSASGSTSAGAAANPASATASVCANVKGTTTMGDGMVMAPVPSGAPTAAQQAAADTLVAQTTAAVAKYANLAAATAAGYVPATNPNGYEVHYANWQIVKSGDVLDPNHPSSLVYANTVSGPVLLGAMYLGAGPCIRGLTSAARSPSGTPTTTSASLPPPIRSSGRPTPRAPAPAASTTPTPTSCCTSGSPRRSPPPTSSSPT